MKIFNIQAYFIDLDGTLLDTNSNKISKENSQALKNTSKKVPIVISTGRAANEFIFKILNDHQLPYAICQNGATIVDKNRNLLLNIVINNDIVKKIINIAIKYKIFFLINSKGKFYGPNLFRHFFSFFSKWKSLPYTSYDHSKINNVNKILLFSPIKFRLKKFKKFVEKQKFNINITFTGNSWAIEITDIKASKGNGSLFVSGLLKVNPKKTVHIGDSMNDSTTLGKVGALIALNNASNSLKKIATHIGPKHKKSGVARVLNGEFKINKKK